MPPFPPKEYFDRHYASDSEVFASDVADKVALARSLRPKTRARFRGLAEFIVCRFQLSLLNQTIYTHFRSAHKGWLAFSAPCASPWYAHRTEIGSGRPAIGSRHPDTILRYAQDPPAVARAEPVRLTWEVLQDYATFFFEEYLARFLAGHQELSILRSEFLREIAADKDCVASLRSSRGWDTKHVTALLPDDGGGGRQDRRWMPATPEEREEIEASVRSAQMRIEIKDTPVKILLDHGPLRSGQETKKLALRLARYERPLDLSSSVWQKAISIAASDNDQDFFRSLGRLLTDDGSRDDEDGQSQMKTQWFLLRHWARRSDGLPELFYLRFPDLLKVCQHHAGAHLVMNEKWLEKVCQRELGLRLFARRTRTDARLSLDEEAERRGECRFRRPDGWLYP